MVKRADQTNGDDRYAQLLCQTESTLFEIVHVAIAGALPLGKNNQTGAVVNSFLRHAPQALQVLRTADIRHGHISKPFHEPAVDRNSEMRFQLPAADQLWDGAIQH